MIQATPFRTIQTDASPLIGGRGARSFPIIVEGQSGIFIPAHSYLRDLSEFQAKSSGTILDVALILSAWFNFLRESDRQWDHPTSRDLLTWTTKPGGIVAGERRRSRCANVVFEFYEFTSRFASATPAVCAFVEELTEPIPMEALVEGRKVARRLRLRFDLKGDSPALRPTPSEADVTKIGEALLSSGSRYREVRDWLLVRTAFETNLRAQGLAGLRASDLDRLLLREGVLPRGSCLESCLGSRHAKAQLRQSLDSFAGTGRQNFILDGVREKGKVRSVLLPIGLMRQLIDFVWGERRRHATRRPVRSSASAAGTDALWLSHKTPDGLLTGSIADILKAGFELANVPGSGHRLRAAHCVKLFRELIREAAANGGGKVDLDALLEYVAQRMGHEDPETLRPYLNAVQLERLVVVEPEQEPTRRNSNPRLQHQHDGLVATDTTA